MDAVAAAVAAQTRERGLYGVACSGGADSLALAHAAIGVLGAAHVVIVTIDHGLAPDSGAVAARVATWASGQGAAAIVRRVTVIGRSEAAARTARHAALEAALDELGLVAMLLGHTARDQAETVLMRVLRGTGPAGLAGIPARRGRFVRPLLALSRAAIDAYVRAHALSVWADPMNADPSFARVRMRDAILPALRRENPQLDAALLRLADSAGEWLAVIDALAAPFARFPIDCAALAVQPAAIRKRALACALEAAEVDYAAAHLDAIDRLVVARVAGQRGLDVPGGRVVRTYDALKLNHRGTEAQRSNFGHPSPILDPLCLCASVVQDLELRLWRPGDRMRPARLKGRSKKLSDLYADAKIARGLRGSARVLVRRGTGAIVWAEHVGIACGEADDLAPGPRQTAGTF